MKTQQPPSKKLFAVADRFRSRLVGDQRLQIVVIPASLIIVVTVFFIDPSRSQAIAGWVQAIGSIVAIFIALRIGQQQSDASIASALSAQQHSERTRQRFALAIVQSANDFAVDVRKAFDAKDIGFGLLSVYDRKVVDNLVAALNALPLHDIGSPEGVSSVLSMRLQFVLLGNAIDAFIAGPWQHPELGPQLKMHEKDASFNKKMLAECVSTGKGVLRKNVLTHLQVIARDHQNVLRAIA
ncbi:hypothetical protein AWB64_00461 [Caballeronia sordidicola]|uniref:Uncharacterized protein n=1 Tax=Caballeronia sordidicola TaxID=196367 RepID=A0A158EWS3_CABSO|nr:hypothetical protein [Caballeronia sordidicola]SAL11978.1 hypothetical protein AWB64_00461 [Caballeronia sordidicola]